MTDSRIIPFPPSEVKAEPVAPRPKPGAELEELSDTELVVLGKSCDEATHLEIVRVLLERHSAKIRAFAFSLARDAGPISREEFADEVVFRFKVKLLEGLLRRRLESEKANGTAYLMRVLRTTALDYYREVNGRRKDRRILPTWTYEGFIARVFEPEDDDVKTDPRWVPVPVEEITDAAQEKIIGRRGAKDAANPDTMFDRKAQGEFLKSLFKEVHAQLGGNHADIFQRHFVDGWKFDEIAAYLKEFGPEGVAHSQSTVQRDYRRARDLIKSILERRGHARRRAGEADE